MSERVAAHVVRTLGTPERETLGTAEGARAAWSILTFRDQPAEGAFTLVTTGLAESLGQELLLCGWDAFLDDAAYQTLFTVGQSLHEERIDVGPGTLVALGQPIPGTQIDHCLLWPPVYHDEALQQIPEEVELLWLIPLLPEEAAWVEARDAAAFEALMLEQDPDFLDWLRSRPPNPERSEGSAEPSR